MHFIRPDNYGVNPSLIPNTEHMLWPRFRLVDNVKPEIESFSRFDVLVIGRRTKIRLNKRIEVDGVRAKARELIAR